MGLRLNTPKIGSGGRGLRMSYRPASGNRPAAPTDQGILTRARAPAIGMSVRGVPGRLYSCVMDFDWDDWTWELMLTKRPPDTHFSESSTPGWKSPLVRDHDNTLVTQAVLSDGTKAVLVLLGTGAALGVAAVKAAPHVKSGLVSLQSKLRRRGEDITAVEAPVSLTVVAEVEPEQPDSPRLRAV